jgi:hypothetical protein
MRHGKRSHGVPRMLILECVLSSTYRAGLFVLSGILAGLPAALLPGAA